MGPKQQKKMDNTIDLGRMVSELAAACKDWGAATISLDMDTPEATVTFTVKPKEDKQL